MATSAAGPSGPDGRLLAQGRGRVGRRPLDADLARLLQDREILRPPKRDTGAVPGRPGKEVRVPAEVAERACVVAFMDGVGAPTGRRTKEVVWTDADSELLVRAARVRVQFDDGLALFGIPVYTEQTQDAEVVVPFAVGSPSAPTGLIMVTEPTPRGPSIVVDRWGEALIAAAWDALVDVAAGIAAAAGEDAAGEPLLPAAFAATPEAIAVLPQAAFR